MKKQEEPQETQELQQIGQVELNQFGRPKQQVIFYQLTEQLKQQAKSTLQKDKTEESVQKYQKAQQDTQKVWDKFYKFHKCNFFKDRTYLERQIQPITLFKNKYNQTKQVSQFVELGCGVGNTLFPLLRYYPCFSYYGFDISKKAIQLIEDEMKTHPEYINKMQVCVSDLSKDQIPYKGHGDLNTLIFVLSAIVPEKHQYVISKIYEWMKPGSFFYFRDYGRYDFGQLNLSSKGNRKLKDNFYMKNDGVCVFYFEKQEFQSLCEKAGFIKIKTHLLCKLLQNRKRNLKMYRVWLQGLFYKPPMPQQTLEQIQKLLINDNINEKIQLIQQKQTSKQMDIKIQKKQEQQIQIQAKNLESNEIGNI